MALVDRESFVTNIALGTLNLHIVKLTGTVVRKVTNVSFELLTALCTHH